MSALNNPSNPSQPLLFLLPHRGTPSDPLLACVLFQNVWGTWNGITPRDGEAIRRVGAMSRFFGGKVDSTSFPSSKRDFLHR